MTEEQSREARRAAMNRPIEPIKMFDDFFYIGTRGVGIYVVKTGEGLVFIDSSASKNAYEEIVVPSLEKLGLQDEKILAVFLTHGHFDHHFGAKSIQDATGCKVGLTQKDTAFMISGVENLDYEIVVPKVNILLEDGKDYVFGDHVIHVLDGAGHTPGCLNYAIEVHEGDEKHLVMIMGGYGIFGPANFYIENYTWNNHEYPYGLQAAVDNALTFASSCERLWLYAKEHNGDVFLNPHPHLCNLFGMAEKAAARTPGDPNPFVIGTDGVRKWILERFLECLKLAGIYSTMLDDDEMKKLADLKF